VTVLPAWWDGAADGPANMAADEMLAAEALERGGLVIRLYGWTVSTVSLGAFQPIAAARAECRGLPIVRRPSGGGAIVHGSDLTYAAAVPRSHPWGCSAQSLYDALHAALVETLVQRGIPARLHGAEDGPGDATALLCFDRRAPGDIVVPVGGGGPAAKVMGSAQRRLGTTVLQHGSLLLRANGDAGPQARHPGLEDLDEAAARWQTRELVESWLGRVAAALGGRLEFQPLPFRSGREERIACGAIRFAEPTWTARR
jgi:lipoate-protein ligase A